MTEADRAKLVQLFDVSRTEFLDCLRGVSEEQARWKPSPDGWSITESAEHIVLAEASLFKAACIALAAAPNPEWEEKTARKTEFIERFMPAVLRRAKAPDPIVPRGGFTLEQAIAEFEAARPPMIALVNETSADVYRQTADHPFPVFGTLNAFQWLLYIPLHTQRHVKQIEALKALARQSS